MGIGDKIDSLLVRCAGRMLRARGMFSSYFGRWRWHFTKLENMGLHVLPVHCYTPIPDSRTLPPSLWEKPSELVGLKLDTAKALTVLAEIGAFRDEYAAFPVNSSSDPTQYYYANGAYGPGDAEVLYGMIRRLKPNRIIEIGSGNTTLIISSAILKNRAEGYLCDFTAIEPYPKTMLRGKIAGLTQLVEKPLQEVPLEAFAQLGENDILFIDSTHIARIGSDVCYELLEIVPRLAKGVYVHVHDIYLPAQYPKRFIVEARFFWNEQYLLHAFLAFNDSFEVVWPGQLMHLRHSDELAEAFPAYAQERPAHGNFWMKRVK